MSTPIKHCAASVMHTKVWNDMRARQAAAKRKFKVWPSAYASGWGVRCTKAGGPSNFGGKK